jgi:release factor glutamine methyltransferase
MTIRAALDEATATLRAAGVDTPRVDAEWLLADLLPGGRRDVVLGLDRALDAGLAARYRGVVHRRAAREPLQLIRGWQDFLDIRVGLAAGVLVPRPETETLAEWALALLPPAQADRRPLVVDVGTGSRLYRGGHRARARGRASARRGAGSADGPGRVLQRRATRAR